MGELALPCVKCGKPLKNVDVSCSNQPHCGTEFTTTGHYGSTIHDEIGDDEIVLELVVNLCDTCILRAIEADVIQSRGYRETEPLLSHHHLEPENKAWVLAQNEKEYGSAWGEDQPVNYEEKMREAGWTLPLEES